MAATRKQSALAKYNQELNEAKAQYLRDNPKLKIAAGFKQTKDYKRIARNKKQWVYCDSRKKVLNDLKKKGDDYKVKPDIVLADKDIYHLVLGYNAKLSRVIRDEFEVLRQEKGDEGAKRKVWVQVKYPGHDDKGRAIHTRTGVYNDPGAVDRAFQELYNIGLEDQRLTGEEIAEIKRKWKEDHEGDDDKLAELEELEAPDSDELMLVDAVQTDGKEGFYFFVTGHLRDK